MRKLVFVMIVEFEMQFINVTIYQQYKYACTIVNKCSHTAWSLPNLPN